MAILSSTFRPAALAWSHASNVVWAFLRNVGASALHMFVEKTEPPKIIVRKSFLFSLLRCCVHLVPMAITAFVVWLNLAGYFIGDQMAGGAENRNRDFLLLQIAAKFTVCNHVPRHSLIIPTQGFLSNETRPAGVVCGRVSSDHDYGHRPSAGHVNTWHTPRSAQLPLSVQ